jgi:hypothetical protein
MPMCHMEKKLKDACIMWFRYKTIKNWDCTLENNTLDKLKIVALEYYIPVVDLHNFMQPFLSGQMCF